MLEHSLNTTQSEGVASNRSVPVRVTKSMTLTCSSSEGLLPPCALDAVHGMSSAVVHQPIVIASDVARLSPPSAHYLSGWAHTLLSLMAVETHQKPTKVSDAEYRAQCEKLGWYADADEHGENPVIRDSDIFYDAESASEGLHPVHDGEDVFYDSEAVSADLNSQLQGVFERTRGDEPHTVESTIFLQLVRSADNIGGQLMNANGIVRADATKSYAAQQYQTIQQENFADTQPILLLPPHNNRVHNSSMSSQLSTIDIVDDQGMCRVGDEPPPIPSGARSQTDGNPLQGAGETIKTIVEDACARINAYLAPSATREKREVHTPVGEPAYWPPECAHKIPAQPYTPPLDSQGQPIHRDGKDYYSWHIPNASYTSVDDIDIFKISSSVFNLFKIPFKACGFVSRQDTINVLKKLSDLPINSMNLYDLKEVVKASSKLAMPEYVAKLLDNVVKQSHYAGRTEADQPDFLMTKSDFLSLVDRVFYGGKPTLQSANDTDRADMWLLDHNTWPWRMPLYRAQDPGQLSIYTSFMKMQGLMYKGLTDLMGLQLPLICSKTGALKPSRHAIAPYDITQGRIGNCYFLTALQALADTQPHILQSALLDNGDSTFTVRFVRPASPHDAGVCHNQGKKCWLSDFYSVSTRLPALGVGSLELWPKLFESAFRHVDRDLPNDAQARKDKDRAEGFIPGYYSIEGGFFAKTAPVFSPRVCQHQTIRGSKVALERQLITNLNTGKLSVIAFYFEEGDNVKWYYRALMLGEHTYYVSGFEEASRRFLLVNAHGTCDTQLTAQELIDNRIGMLDVCDRELQPDAKVPHQFPM